jgi:cell wall-associated NlpC family hydrolase
VVGAAVPAVQEGAERSPIALAANSAVERLQQLDAAQSTVARLATRLVELDDEIGRTEAAVKAEAAAKAAARATERRTGATAVKPVTMPAPTAARPATREVLSGTGPTSGTALAAPTTAVRGTAATPAPGPRVPPAVTLAGLRVARAALLSQQIEAGVVAHAAELGHDVARRDLAGAVSKGLGGVDPVALDQAWTAADSRRLGVMYTALSQVGDPYVFDTAGPAQFDCSGLTLYAWQTIGVRLAHYSFTQRAQTPVADPSRLQPGDLIFNLRPTGGHVMLSLGLGQLMVHAPAPGRTVTVSRWHRATGFGSPLATPEVSSAPLPTATGAGTTTGTAPALQRSGGTTPLLPATTAATTSGSATSIGAAATSSAEVPVDEATRRVAARYGMDPALLQAVSEQERAEPSAIRTAGAPEPIRLRSDLLAKLGADAADPASVLDAAARYLVTATTDLGDLATALAALQVGAGPATAGTWPAPVRTRVDAVLARADELHQVHRLALTPAQVERTITILTSGWAIRQQMR